MSEQTSLQVLLATGDRELEARLAAALPTEGVAIAARCLDADSLLEQGHAGTFDSALVSAGLHGLTGASLQVLRDRGLRVLLLAAEERQAGRFGGIAPTLPASTPAADLAVALRRLGMSQSDTAMPETAPAGSRSAGGSTDGSRGQVIAVASGKGAPGKTTLAIALAHQLGASGRSVALVDADLRGGNVAPYLDLDPRRGLMGLGGAGDDLAERLDDELQAGPECAVLAGLERPEVAAALPEGTLAAAIAALRARVERVVVDLGSPPASETLRAAQVVLVVTGADLVAVWNTRLALTSLRSGVPARFLAVLNRREGREHYDPQEVERALGIPVVGSVREDRRAARRALERQVPITSESRRVMKEMRQLADTLQAATLPATVLATGGAALATEA